MHYAGTTFPYWVWRLIKKNDVQNVDVCSCAMQDFPFLSGNMVRDMIRLGYVRWKNFVHPENIELINKYFDEGGMD
ncbi:MAG: hypothetical protein IKZ02_03275 [Alphaproteobacteria bacterium]|nr:hypothetical protein [Alphaproteobacteria bacterium]